MNTTTAEIQIPAERPKPLQIRGFEIVEPTDKGYAFDPRKLTGVGIDFHDSVASVVSRLVHRYGSIAPKIRIVSERDPLKQGEIRFANRNGYFVRWSERFTGRCLRVYVCIGDKRFFHDFPVSDELQESEVTETMCLDLFTTSAYV